MWQSRPVFISSTFADMQAERDYLRSRVFPELEERLRDRHVHLEWVDLRIGIATAPDEAEGSRELQVLKVCLAEVRRCRPLIIVLLGDRYGWIPPPERMAAAIREEGAALDTLDRSVTELEIEYGVLSESEIVKSFFYFRSSLPYQRMPPSLASRYADACATDDGAKIRAERLVTLKQKIKAKLPDRVREYAAGWDEGKQKVVDLENWGRQVLEDLWGELAAEIPLAPTQDLSWQELERAELKNIIEFYGNSGSVREPILQQVMSFAFAAQANTREPWGLRLIGDHGSGKTHLFAELYRRLIDSPALLLAHATNAGPRSNTVDAMLRIWCAELAAKTGNDVGLADQSNPAEVLERFASLLHTAASSMRVVVLVDALDQFVGDGAITATWLPRPWPRNARFVAFSAPQAGSSAVAHIDGVEDFRIPPLGEGQARQIIAAVCARYHRTLEEEVIAAVLARRNEKGFAWTNPLWLQVATEELNLVDADDFDRAERDYSGSPSEQLRALMVDTANQLPTDIMHLYGASFQRAEKLFGSLLVKSFLHVMAASLVGWRESDLEALLPRVSGEPWNAIQYAVLRRFFRAQLRQDGQWRQLRFSSFRMHQAVRAHWPPQRALEQMLHSGISDHQLTLPVGDPLRHQLMLHLVAAASSGEPGDVTRAAEDWRRAAAYYGDPALSSVEAHSATNVLTNLVCHFGAGLVIKMLDAPATDPIVLRNVAFRLLFDLLPMLTDVGPISARGALAAAIRKVFAILWRQEPTQTNHLFCLSTVDKHLGDFYMMTGDDELARAAFEESRSFAHQLLGIDAANTKWQTLLAESLTRIGDAALRRNQFAPAVAAFEQAAGVANRLASSDPSNSQWQENLGVALRRLAEIREHTGDYDGALAALRHSLEICRQLVNSESDGPRAHFQLGLTLAGIGRARTAIGDKVNALAAYEESLHTFRNLTSLHPSHALYQRDLCLILERIGALELDRGDRTEAIKAIEESVARRRQLVSRDPAHKEWRQELRQVLLKLGEIVAAVQDHTKAIALYRECLEHCCQLATVPEQLNERWMGILLNRIGDQHHFQGDAQAALAAYEELLPIAQKLADADPGNADYMRGLESCRAKIADARKTLLWERR